MPSLHQGEAEPGKVGEMAFRIIDSGASGDIYVSPLLGVVNPGLLRAYLADRTPGDGSVLSSRSAERMGRAVRAHGTEPVAL